MARIVEKLSDEAFVYLIEFLEKTCQVFYFSKIAHKKIGENDNNYDKYKEVWKWILNSLRCYYIVKLSNLFDPSISSTDSGRKYNISIMRVVSKEKFGEENQKTIDNIRSIRKKIISHFDEENILSGKKTEENYELDFEKEKIAVLIKNIFEVLNREKSKYNYDKELNLESIEKHVEEKFDDWYKIFLKNN